MFSQNKKDILERLLADISRIVAKLMGFAAEEALQQIQEHYQGWLGLDKKEVDQLAPEALLEVLIGEKDFQIPQLELLAELLAAEGEILGNNQQFFVSSQQLQKALVIFDHVEKHADVFSFNRRDTIARTEQLLKTILEKL